MQLSDTDSELDTTSPEEKWLKQYEGMPYKELAARMVELRTKAAAAKVEETTTNKELDVIRLKVVPTRFAKDGYSSLNIPGVGRLGLASDAYCTQKPECKDELFEFLRLNDGEDLIKEGVNASSLKSYVKELVQEASDAAAAVEFDPEAEQVDPEPTKFDEICKYVNYIPFMRASVTKT